MKISSKTISVIFVSVLAVSMAFAQGGGGGGRGQGRGGQRGNQFSEMALVQRADVQKDLGLTDDQKTKITDYVEKNRPQRGAGGAGGGAGAGGGQRGGGAGGGQLTDEQRAAMQKAAEERAAKQKADLAEIIGADKVARLGEIAIQLQGNTAITREPIQNALGLSSDQVDKIKSLQKDQTTANQALQQKMRDQEITREDLIAKMTANTETLKTELGKILTADQAAKLKAMGGKTFTPDPPAL